MRKGFTLIELLIVIAIMGILTTIVLILLNPLERLAQSRDSGRINTVMQMGRALQSFYTTSSNYPANASWDSDMVSTGYPKAFPPGVHYGLAGTANCTTNVLPAVNPTYCYNYDDTQPENGAIIYATMESRSQLSKCEPDVTYFAYSSVDGRGGILCLSAEPTPWPEGSVDYLD